MCLTIHHCLLFQNSTDQIYWAIFSIKFHPKPPELGLVDTLSAVLVQFHWAVSLLSHCQRLSPSSEDDRNPGFVKVLMGLKVLISNSPTKNSSPVTYDGFPLLEIIKTNYVPFLGDCQSPRI